MAYYTILSVDHTTIVVDLGAELNKIYEVYITKTRTEEGNVFSQTNINTSDHPSSIVVKSTHVLCLSIIANPDMDHSTNCT